MLVALYGNARQSYASLGRRVSLSAPAVRDRLNHLKKNGILQGFMLVIDSSVFDRDDLLLFFHDNSFSRKSVLAAFAAPDVSWVAWKVDGRIHTRLWTKNEHEAIDNLAKILGVRPSKRALKPRKRRVPVSITELSIMDALVDDPRASLGEILKTTGLSPKTVRKHLNRLLETKTIFIDPLLGVLRDSPGLVYTLVVAGRVSMDQVRRIMDDAAQIHHTVEPPMKHVLCRASSLADVITKTRVLENLQGVESVTISLDREVLVSTDLRHYLIREEIMKLEKNRTGYSAPIEVPDKG